MVSPAQLASARDRESQLRVKPETPPSERRLRAKHAERTKKQPRIDEARTLKVRALHCKLRGTGDDNCAERHLRKGSPLRSTPLRTHLADRTDMAVERELADFAAESALF